MRPAGTTSLRGLAVLVLISTIVAGCSVGSAPQPTRLGFCGCHAAEPSGVGRRSSRRPPRRSIPRPVPARHHRPPGRSQRSRPPWQPTPRTATPSSGLGVALLNESVRPPTHRSTREPRRPQQAGDLAPTDPLPLVGLGTPWRSPASHQFAAALAWAAGAEPRAGPVDRAGVVDVALVELGRYPEAVTAVQKMVDFRPDLASYARVSYVRELYGDLPGALDAMRRAVEAGGQASENNAYVIVLYGNLLVLSGRRTDAGQAYDALAPYADYPAALAAQGSMAVAAGG